MKKFFYILFLPLLLSVSCLIYPAKTKTYFHNNHSDFMYGVKIYANVFGHIGNGGDVPPYKLILTCDIKNSLCKTVTFEEVIVNKNTFEYRSNELFSTTDSEGERYDLPKEFNLDDMEDSTPIYISLKVTFELSDGSIKEEWLGFILYPKFKTQWLNSMFSV